MTPVFFVFSVPCVVFRVYFLFCTAGPIAIVGITEGAIVVRNV